MEQDLSVREEQTIIYEKWGKKAVDSIRKRRMNALFAGDREEALRIVMDMIPEEATVGTADSTTLLQVGVFSALRKRGKNEIINPFMRDKRGTFLVEAEERRHLMRRALLSDVFIISTNAVTLDGKLVNVDGSGNRVAAMLFGPKKVIIVAGANKITKDLEEALKRIREYCAPTNVIRHGNKHHRPDFLDIPCAKTGVCADCRHPWRICNYTVIIEGEMEPNRGRMNVVLVGEALGL